VRQLAKDVDIDDRASVCRAEEKRFGMAMSSMRRIEYAGSVHDEREIEAVPSGQ
jgi:hypothetical protein